MPRYILHRNDLFLEWSTVVDSPVSAALERDAFVAHMRATYPPAQNADLERRMERALATGVSVVNPPLTLEDVIAHNKAGVDEGELTVDQIFDLYRPEGARGA